MDIKNPENKLECNLLRNITRKSELSIREDCLLFLLNQSIMNDEKSKKIINQKQTRELIKWEKIFECNYRCFLTALIINNKEAIESLHTYLQKNKLSDLSYFPVLSTIVKETNDLYQNVREFITKFSYHEFTLALK